MRVAERAGLAAFLLLAAFAAFAQEEPAPATEEESAWEFGASLYAYFPPEDLHYGQPTVTADHGGLHLEGRYNYENFRAGSAWIGWNFGFGEEFRIDATLMAGGVFGETRGVAPGYHLTVSYGRFELYSEGEYVVDVDDSDDNFLYNWAQLGYSPLDWLAVGLASQRTRVYRTGLDVQRGVFVSFTRENANLSVYVFNPGWESPTVVAALAFTF
jgi:hypothetical protein